MRKDKKVQKKKPGVNMPLVIIVLLVCVGAGIATANYFSKSGKTKKGTAQTGTPAMGIPIPELKTAEDVKAYMRIQLETPIPRKYKFPDYILNAPTYDAAMMELNKRYPNFSGKEGTELINAVWRNPMEHQQMTLENKAARLQFNPTLMTDPRYGGRQPGE